MKKEFMMLGGVMMALSMWQCGQKSEKEEIPVIDLVGNLEKEDPGLLAVKDVAYIPLDAKEEALLNGDASIVGVIGDTVIVKDGAEGDRLLMFDATTGRHVRTISHVGNGPGEYRWIERVMVDEPDRSVVLKDVNGRVMRYTLEDSLKSFKLLDIPQKGGHLSVALANKMFLSPIDYDNDLVVRRISPEGDLIDSIRIENGAKGFYSGVFVESAGRGFVSVADTLYEMKPEGIERMAIISYGGKDITPEIERSLKDMEFEKRMAEMEKYINTHIMGVDDEILIMVGSYNDAHNLMVNSLKDGRLLRKIRVGDKDGESLGFGVDYGDNVFHLRSFYPYKGKWYSLVMQEESVDSEGNPGDGDLNNGLISFRMEAIE